MLQRVPMSLNTVSHESAMNLIRIVLDKGVRVAKVYVDTVGDPGSYQAKLTRSFARSIEFTVCSKADSLYKTVSAASICAKVTRDKCLREWVYTEPLLAAQVAPLAAAPGAVAADSGGEDEDDEIEASADGTSRGADAIKRRRTEPIDDVGLEDDAFSENGAGEGVAAMMARRRPAAAAATASSASSAPGAAVPPHPVTAGSGYPGDPAAKRWLTGAFDRVFGWPSVVRFSWSTAKDRLEADGVPVAWEEADAPGSAAAGGDSSGPQQAGMASFFGAAATAGGGGSRLLAAAPRPAWFRKRHMKVAVAL